MTVKPWYTSKTVWVSIITTALMFLSGTQFLAVIPAGAQKYIGAFGFLLACVLRAIPTDSQAGLARSSSSAAAQNSDVDPRRLQG